MKTGIAMLLLLFCSPVYAVNVLWDCVTQNYGQGNEIGINYEVDTMFMLDLVFYTRMDEDVCHVVARSASLGASENLVVAHVGDVVDEHTTRHLPPTDYYHHAYIDDENYYGKFVLDVEKGGDFYWMFAISDDMMNPDNPRYVYGWVNVGVDGYGNLSLLRSALDLDGGPVIVGSGSATPEPSSGLLLLLGLGVFGLRRRRGM